MELSKEPYLRGRLEIILFSEEDLIATSGNVTAGGDPSLGGNDGTGSWTGT